MLPPQPAEPRAKGRGNLQTLTDKLSGPQGAAGALIVQEAGGDASEIVKRQFAEVIIAPAYTPEALAVFGAKQNLRVLVVPLGRAENVYDFSLGNPDLEPPREVTDALARELGFSDQERSTLDLAALIREAGLLGDCLDPDTGKWAVRCPWEHDHSSRAEEIGSDTAIFASEPPGFRCLHVARPVDPRTRVREPQEEGQRRFTAPRGSLRLASG